MTATATRSRTKAERYIAGVIAGEIVASKWVRQQCERHQRDLKSAKVRGLQFNRSRAQHVIAFIESFIVGTEGDFDGKPYILEPWEAALLWILYGWEWTETKRRRFKFAYCEIGRGNKKSTLASALCVYELVASGEAGAQVYSAATDKETAKLVFETAKLMVEKSQELRRIVKGYRNNLHIPGTAAKFEPCSSDENNLMGKRPSFIVLDELHAHASSGVWDVFVSAMGKRKQPLLFAITNSGYDRHSVCWKQREYSTKVLQGIIPDDTWFAWVCGLDEGDDWEDERNWQKANPSLGVAVSVEDMRTQAMKAKEDPSARNAFLRFRLSVWTESHTVWMPAEKWAACDFPVDAAALAGRQCFGGLDLSTTTDVSAFVLLFPPDGSEDRWAVLPWFFLPAESVQQRAKRDRVPYDVWHQQGLFELTPGNVIDYDYIRAKVNECSAVYRIKEIGYDAYNSTEIVTRLTSDGVAMVPFRQGDVSMTAPLKRLMELVLKRELAHGGNPVLSWMASNTVVKIGPTGLMKPDKEKSRDKIDGISALLDALGRAMVTPIEKPKASFQPFFV